MNYLAAKREGIPEEKKEEKKKRKRKIEKEVSENRK